MSVNIYDKTSDELQPIAGNTSNSFINLRDKPKINGVDLVGGGNIELATSSQLNNVNGNTSAYTSRTYTAGEYCIYNDKLWYAKINNGDIPGTTNAWEEINLSTLKSSLINTSNELSNSISNLIVNKTSGDIDYRNTENNSIFSVLKSSNLPPRSITFWTCQNAEDNPKKGNITFCLIAKFTNDGTYSIVWLFSSYEIYSATTYGTLPSALTFTKII